MNQTWIRDLLLPGVADCESKYPGLEMDIQPSDSGGMKFFAYNTGTKKLFCEERPREWLEGTQYKNEFGTLLKGLAERALK